MKKLLLAALLLPYTALAQTTHPSGVSGCIVRYDFNSTPDSLRDVSGNNHGATAFNLTSSSGFRYRPGNAMHFNGIDAGARAEASSQFNVNQVSMVALVKFTGFYSGNCQGNAIVNRTSNYYTAGTWGIDISDHNFDQSCSTFSPNNEQPYFVTSSVSVPAPAVGNFLTQNDWYLLVATYDGNVVTMYQTKMDTGTRLTSIAPVYTLTYGIPLGTNNDSLRIGWMSHPSFRYWFNGDMDELTIFNKALSNTEVKAVYDYLWGPGSGLGVAGSQNLDNVSLTLVNDMLQVRNPLQGTVVHATVYDMSGRVLCRREVGHDIASIDMGSYAAGMLMVRLECDGAVVTKKVSRL
jgi:hypothetical protein